MFERLCSGEKEELNMFINLFDRYTCYSLHGGGSFAASSGIFTMKRDPAWFIRQPASNKVVHSFFMFLIFRSFCVCCEYFLLLE